MSTRCNVLIKNQREQTHVLYCHWDGYPKCVGVQLEKFFKYCNDSVVTSVDACARFINDMNSSYEMNMCIAPDIDYLYTIDIDNRTIQCERVAVRGEKTLVYLAQFGEEVASQY